MTDPVDRWVKEPTPAMLARQELAMGNTNDAAAFHHLARAKVFAILAVADALSGMRSELGYIGNAIAEDQTP